MKKYDGVVQKCMEKNIEKSSKIGPEICKKYKKYRNDRKIPKKSTRGANFWPRRWFWVDVGVPEKARKFTF